MAVCTLSTLQSDACENGFYSLSHGDQLNVALALAYTWLGGAETLEELYADACSNGFTSLSYGDQLSVALQLLCDISGG